MSKLFYATLLCCFASGLYAQIQLTGAAVTIDFDGTPAEAGNGQYTGGGFDPAPAAGQLDSDAFSVLGFSDGDLNFGGTATSADFTRTSTGATGTGGLFANTEVVSNILGAASAGTRLLVQPTGGDFNPGEFIILAQNATGGPINQLQFSADICVRNDQDRNTAIGLDYSLNGVTYLPVLATTTTDATGTANTGVPFMICSNSGTFTLTFAAPVPNGGFVYFRITSQDAPGDTASGSRDEFAIDNIVLSNFILPVQLINFEVSATLPGNLLTWTTATELNNDYFEVQRSTDGKNWTTLAEVSGNGTTETESHYEFLDRTASTGLNYYRLQQFDYDGASEIHPTISVRTVAKGTLAVFPNPVQDALHLRVNAPATVLVTDLMGRQIQQVNIDADASDHTLDASQWSAGTYFVTIQNGTETITERIVKR